MRHSGIAAAIFLGTLAGGTTALADDLALIIANQDYRSMRDARGARSARDAAAPLRAAGFEVLEWQDSDLRDMGRLAREAEAALAEADRVVVLMSGHFARSDADSWLMMTDARATGPLSAGASGLSVQGILQLLADKAGAAVLMAGQDGPQQTVGSGLGYGFAARDIPQGVTVFTGPTDALTDMVETLLEPGVTTARLADTAPRNVQADGFLSRTVAFIPLPAPADGMSDADRELLAWSQAKSTGTEAALQDYLVQYPQGRFAVEARALLSEMRKTPQDLAREAEAALGLNTDSRRDIQRNLSLLGYDPRGIDGIFGPGTRAAISAWQASNGYERTGYLTGNQITALQSAANARARQLEEEARKRRLEQDRLDTDYWRETGRDGGEEGLRAYLRRFPDGLYSDIARERLEVYEEERRRTAAREEAGAWDAAEAAGTQQAYQDFLRRYPNGAFADSARQKLEELKVQQSDEDVVAAARNEEKLVLANPITRLLVERQLDRLGLKPGTVDGRIDNQTRKALRRFQRSADLPVTGYANQETVVRLLSSQGG